MSEDFVRRTFDAPTDADREPANAPALPIMNSPKAGDGEALPIMNREDRLARIAELEAKIAEVAARLAEMMPKGHLYDRALTIPASAMEDLVAAVPDEVVRGIVRDNRVSPMSVFRPLEPPKRGSGLYEPPPLGPPPGIEQADRVAEGFARRDLAEAIVREMEHGAVIAERRRRGDGEAG
jgi:hypothetical protein